MKILIGTDSRGVIPSKIHSIGPLTRNWVDVLLEDLRGSQDIVKFYRAVNDVYVFTLPQFKKHCLDLLDDYYDLAIIQTGWHEYVCPWPVDMQKSFYPDTYDDRYIIETQADGRVRYFNEKEIRDVVSQLKKVSKRQLFIGMQSLLNIPGSILGGEGISQKNIAESNAFFSELEVDYLPLPSDPNWALRYCSSDKIHYMDGPTRDVATYISRYINRLDDTLQSKILSHKESSTKITVDGVTKTYEEIINESQKIGNNIAGLTTEGDVVVIAKNTSFEQITAFLGCILYKRIPLFVQPNTGKVPTEILKSKLQHIADLVSPTLCFAEATDLDIFQSYFPTFSIIHDTKINIELPSVNRNDIAFIQLSSGTTAIPKVISVTHQQLIEHCDEYGTFIGLNSDDYISSWLPLYHDMGLIACFLMPFIKGIGFTHIDPFKWLSNPNLFYEDITKNKTTLVWLPNFAFAKLSNDTQVPETTNLSSIRQLISCAEPVSVNNVDDFYRNFTKFGLNGSAIRVCYALAENIFAVTQSTNVQYNENGYVSCGKLIPGSSIMIYDGQDVTGEGIGSVCIKSAYQPVKSDILGYYNTGDIGFIANEELYIIGRESDKIVSYGVNYFPYEFEEAVSCVAGIIPGRVVCFGVYNDSIGTQEIYLAAETNNATDKLRLTVYKAVNNIVKKVILVPHGYLLKTSSGKICRKSSRDKLIKDGYIGN